MSSPRSGWRSVLDRQSKVRQLQSRIRRASARVTGRPYFATGDVVVGAGASFGRNVVFNSERVTIGDAAIIGDNVKVDAASFEIGDYATIYEDCFFPGPGSVQIGHNFWLGKGAIVDAMGGVCIGNNVCAGPYSQLWSHQIFGDTVYGCRFRSVRSMRIEDDVWLGGGCLVSPIRAGARSMALQGSIITKDLLADHTYAGCPAEDVTPKLGPQYDLRPVPDRKTLVEERIGEFARRSGRESAHEIALVVTTWGSEAYEHDGRMVFNVADRTYLKAGTAVERALMRFLLPEAKFVPSSHSRLP